jgi:Glycine zipper
MPQSKNRKAHKQHADYIPHKKKTKSAVPVAIGFCALLAFGIAWFAAGPSVIGLVIGAAVGGVIGYFAGKEMDKAFAKK